MSNAGIVVVKHALFTGAGGADISTGIAAYASRKLSAPELESFVGRHLFELFDHIEAVRIKHFAVLAHKLVVDDVVAALAA